MCMWFVGAATDSLPNWGFLHVLYYMIGMPSIIQGEVQMSVDPAGCHACRNASMFMGGLLLLLHDFATEAAWRPRMHKPDSL